MDDAALVTAVARHLLAARQAGRTVDLVSGQFPGLDLQLAERIAAASVALSGDAVVGIKLGFTSMAMRQQMNIAAPNFGWLTAAMDMAGATPPRFVHPRVEPEVAVILGRPIGDAPLAAAAALRAIDSVHAALEIVDTRYHDYRFTLLDNTADNSSAAGYVLGPPHPPAGIIDQPLAVVLRQDGKPVAQGSSADAMGGPLAALAWLAQALCTRGRTLPAGAIILTGGLTPAPYLRPGEPVSAAFAGLGEVSI